jgi:hypothetical protein
MLMVMKLNMMIMTLNISTSIAYRMISSSIFCKEMSMLKVLLLLTIMKTMKMDKQMFILMRMTVKSQMISRRKICKKTSLKFIKTKKIQQTLLTIKVFI